MSPEVPVSVMNEPRSTPPDGLPVPTQVNHLQRRELQAPVAACLIREFAAVLGRDAAIEIATRAIREDARKSGRDLADRFGGNGLADLRRVIEEVWAEADAVAIRWLESTEDRLNFDVTRCRYAEMYEAMGMKELGFCLSCSRDGAFVEGYNNRISLTRTQTLMEGASCCDFRFTRRS